MNKRRIAAGLSIAVSVCIAIVLHSQAQSPQLGKTQQESKSDSSSLIDTSMPEHVFYGQFFSLLVALNNSGDYQKQAALTNNQRSSLEQIAKQCERAIAAQDAKAEITIRTLRDKWTTQPGETPPPPPPEIAELQRERDAIVLHHRDRLRAALGEDAFRRVTEGAKTMVHISVDSASPTH